MQAFGREDVPPENVSLNEVPKDLRVEGHEKYEEAVEELNENYGEEIDAFEKSVDNLFERIESSENPAIINHSVPWGKKNPHGSMVVREAVREYGDKLEFVSGGHMHSPGMEELEGVDVINSAQTVTEIGVTDETYYNINSNTTSKPSESGESNSMSHEEKLEQIEEQIEYVANSEELPKGLDQEDVEDYKSQLEQRKQELEQKI